MVSNTFVRASLAALAVGALLAACGGSSSSTTSQSTSSGSSSTSSSSGSSSSSSSGNNPALTVALTASDLPSGASGYVQASDGLLGTTPNTDARVFANPANTSRIEVDLAVDTDATAAGNDYSAYNASASKQVVTQSGTATPSIGSQANEYGGTDKNGHSIVSLAFVQGKVICVVTMVSSSGTVDASLVEAVASAQATKLSSAGL
jgi:hypothetical protein